MDNEDKKIGIFDIEKENLEDLLRNGKILWLNNLEERTKTELCGKIPTTSTNGDKLEVIPRVHQCNQGNGVLVK